MKNPAAVALGKLARGRAKHRLTVEQRRAAGARLKVGRDAYNLRRKSALTNLK